MPSDVIEPPLEPGTPAAGPPAERPAPAPNPLPPELSSGEMPTLEPPAPDPPSVSSWDELTLSLAEPRPDPMLGEYRPGSGRPGAVASSSGDVFAALGVQTDASSPPGPAAAPADEPEDDDEEYEEPRGRGPGLTTILLASYASAVTIGLAWVLWTGRRVRETPESEPPAAEAKADPGVRADRSHRISPPGPVDPSRLTDVGKPLKVGALEVTPLGVSAGAVVLERTIAGHQIRGGGKNALKLRLRLRNTSPDLVFAPLDEAFVRQTDRDALDTWVDAGPGTTPVTMYPLAVSSEWSVDGQTFRELKPGEVFETDVVSAPDAASNLPAEATWRVRLRTGLNETAEVGVRFKAEQVRREP